MSTYSIQLPLKSCLIDKSIIIQLEDYVLSKASSINPGDKDEVKSNFKITIDDSFGTETFNSIREYVRNQFPNDIKRIVVSYYNFRGPLNNLDINFSVENLRSEIKVVMAGSNAKEIVNGITQEVNSIIKETSNLNFIFYGNYSIFIGVIFSWCLCYSILTLFLSAVREGQNTDISTILVKIFVILSLLFICFIWWILKMFNPYIVFDTKKNRNIKQVSKFLVRGTLGLLIFDRLIKLIWK